MYFSLVLSNQSNQTLTQIEEKFPWTQNRVHRCPFFRIEKLIIRIIFHTWSAGYWLQLQLNHFFPFHNWVFLFQLSSIPKLSINFWNDENLTPVSCLTQNDCGEFSNHATINLLRLESWWFQSKIENHEKLISTNLTNG